MKDDTDVVERPCIRIGPPEWVTAWQVAIAANKTRHFHRSRDPEQVALDHGWHIIDYYGDGFVLAWPGMQGPCNEFVVIGWAFNRVEAAWI